MKKFLAFVLALVMLVAGLSVSSFAKEDVVPVIVVSGVGTRPFYMDYGTENEKSVFPPENIDIGFILTTAVKGIAVALVKSDTSAFSKAVADIIDNIFEEFKCDENGNSKYNVSADVYPLSSNNYDFDVTDDAPEIELVGAVSEKIGAENTYFYNYDWRLDPCSNADGLEQMIENVKAETESSKVNLIPCSMGGVQTVAYLQKYGSSDIDSIVFASAAHKGLYFVSELFTGNLDINQKELLDYLSLCIRVPDQNADNLLSLVFSDLSNTPYVSNLLTSLIDFILKLNDENLWNVVRNTFGLFPGMWAFVCDEYFDDAIEFMTDENTSPELLKKLTYYHENVGSKSDEILAKAQKDGVKISILSHYGRGSVPVTPTANMEGDLLIETQSTSNGATVMPNGEFLPDDYTQAVACSHNHISANRKIDASTCLFPESTWFIYGQSHVGEFYNDGFNEYAEFVCWLLSSKEQPTVHSNPEYPQFMKAVGVENDLEPIDDSVVPTDYLTEAKVFLTTAVNSIINLIKK